MTPDEQFSRLIRIAMAGFALMFLYFLLADLNMPLSTEAMATRSTTKVSPRVSGVVEQVNVHNNQMVKKGDVLFEIDPQPFKLAVIQAKLELEQARQNNDELDASIAAAKADLKSSQTIAVQKQRDARRLDNLYKSHGISQQEKDQADSASDSARANMMAAKAQLEKLQVTRGLSGEANLQVRQAMNKLAQAKLDLGYTKIKADKDGMVTNLYLEEGSFKNAGSPALVVVSTDVDVIGDFREKNLIDTQAGDAAYVTFDGRPGKVYQVNVDSIDAGVSAGQFDDNGVLATPEVSTRWVRDAQRMRVHFAIKQQAEPTDALMLPTGARASVQLIPDNTVFAWFAYLQVKLVSILHYIY